MTVIENLIERGVNIPAPAAVVIEDIDENAIEPGATIYPGTTICGQDTFIGANTKIGQGGGAYVENCQIGRNCTLMQGCYRESTMLDGFNARNGAEVRDNCLLEEQVSLGHTVGLKQTIFMTNVVAGSLINFCDALMCGGTSRKHHSEIGSCMALYNFTPQGDKFASLFGDVMRGVWLSQPPIFIGGQTQLISPIHVGFGSIIAAGSRVNQNVGDDRMVTGSQTSYRDRTNAPHTIHRADEKIENTREYINNLFALKAWYELVRMPALKGVSAYDKLLPHAVTRIDNAIHERFKRFDKFIRHLHAALEITNDIKEADLYKSWLQNLPEQFGVIPNETLLKQIADVVRKHVTESQSYEAAIHACPDDLKLTTWYKPDENH